LSPPGAEDAIGSVAAAILVQTERVVIVITGPIASGKSTVAQALAAKLDDAGRRAAVIDLDLVHDELIAQGTPADDVAWSLARDRAAAQANGLVADGVDVVIAEGSFNVPSDRARFAGSLRIGEAPVYVTLQVSFEEALRRAQGDPTRGRSRDPDFLRSHFADRGDVLAAVPATDIVIDTERTTAAAAATAITDRLVTYDDDSDRRPDAS